MEKHKLKLDDQQLSYLVEAAREIEAWIDQINDEDKLTELELQTNSELLAYAQMQKQSVSKQLNHSQLLTPGKRSPWLPGAVTGLAAIFLCVLIWNDSLTPTIQDAGIQNSESRSKGDLFELGCETRVIELCGESWRRVSAVDQSFTISSPEFLVEFFCDRAQRLRFAPSASEEMVLDLGAGRQILKMNQKILRFKSSEVQTLYVAAEDGTRGQTYQINTEVAGSCKAP